MIVGENARPDDLPVNPCKTKHLTNMRSQGDGKGIQLEAPLKMTLERAIEYISADEYVEVTPKSLRLRKRVLDATARKRAANACFDEPELKRTSNCAQHGRHRVPLRKRVGGAPARLTHCSLDPGCQPISR